MTISTSLTEAERTATESPPALLQPRLPRKSHYLQQRIPLQGALSDSDIIPEGHEANCMRFYKGSSGRERRPSGPAAVAMAMAVPVTRRPRRRWTKRRPRSRVAHAWERHNCGQSDEAQDISVSRSPTVVKEESKWGKAADTRSPTTDTRSSGTGSTASSILHNLSKDSDLIDTDPCRVQYIFHGGRLRAVQVMKWPEKLRIPTTERYRHEEPMKQRYGQKSLLCRLVRGLELSRTTAGPVKASDFRRPIPLLPRRMIESTKTRLLLWYKPLESSGEFHAACQTD